MATSLGQITGGTATDNAAEAEKLLNMIHEAGGYDKVLEYVSIRAADFFISEWTRYNGNKLGYRVSGTMLFWLRDTKDRLVEEGQL